MRILLTEADYARRLSLATRELLDYSKSLTVAQSRTERKAFIEEMAADGRVMLAPKPGQDPASLYSIDHMGTAHIPIVGQLTPAAEKDICGGYTADALTEYGYIVAASQAADRDPKVQSVDYEFDTPGGYVSGVESAAQAMASVSKPTRAIIGNMAASAGYWLASQTDRIVATSPASRVGSIGVIAEEFDGDRMLEGKGIDHRVYTSTAAPLKHADTKTPQGQAQVVADLDAIHSVFRARVAEGRGVTTEKVDADFGKGAVLTAQAALAAGMIDEIQGQSIGRKALQGGGGVAASAEKAIKLKGNIMTLEELKAQNPEVYQAAVAVGHGLGVKAEQDRVRDLMVWSEGNFNADVKKVATEAIAQGKTFAEVQSQLMAANASGAQPKAGANPPAASTDEGGAVPAGLSMTAEDQEAAALFGMNLADYAKYKTKEGK